MNQLDKGSINHNLEIIVQEATLKADAVVPD